MDEHATRLVELVRADVHLMEILRAVRELDPPDWVVGAGVIRNLVWDALHGNEARTEPADVDVAFLDAADVSRERDRAIERRLHHLVPDVPWEVTNQAGVHLWYESKFGHPIAPITSIEDAIGRWPETATAVAVRLDRDDRIGVVAPCGLDDLFGLVLRRNPRQVTPEYFEMRVRSKRISERWPKVTIVREAR